MMQAKASGSVNSLHEMRYIISNSIELDKFAPADNEKWENAYKNFLTIIKH